MKSISRFLSDKKSLGWILALGALLRLLFVFIGGPIYYGQADYFFQGDTSSWFRAFINLVEQGTFTVSNANPAGKFFRPPGYSFLFGMFYLLAFKNYVLAWKLLVAAQVLMDIASIFIISRIANCAVKNASNDSRTGFSNLCALLYALYPFAISWAPILYAETSSVFFLLLSIYFAFQKRSNRTVLLSGLFGGIATLIRLQCAFGLPFIALVFFFNGRKNFGKSIRQATIFALAIAGSYGLWPVRNFILHGRVLFSQDLQMGQHWSVDFMSFLDFTHSISTDHTKYYWQILKNEKVDWPPNAYLDPQDSLLLDSAVAMCRTCGTGFAYWRWGEGLTPALELPALPCDSAIHGIFRSLYLKQKERNTLHYWFVIPMKNLEKSFFKITLYEGKGTVVQLFSSLLFIFRSCLLILGIFGIYLAFKSKFLRPEFLLLVSGYFIAWYLFLSFFYRNMEMRYLLHTDILMLIPAACVFILLLNKKNREAT